MDEKTTKLMFSSESDEYGTPKEFFDSINSLYHFTLDAAASDKNHKCNKYFTKENSSLDKDWSGETVWINPPYSNIEAFMKKAMEETRKNENTKVVMLVPARTDTKWFHKYGTKAAKILFIKGRLKFENSKNKILNSAPFPSMLLYFNKTSADEIKNILIVRQMDRKGNLL